MLEHLLQSFLPHRSHRVPITALLHPHITSRAPQCPSITQN
jgi:hypothetical protein